MFCWGDNTRGQLLESKASIGSPTRRVTTPSEATFFRNHSIVDLSGNDHRSVVVEEDGSVFDCRQGNGPGEESEQLSTPVLMVSFEAMQIRGVACGQDHVLVLSSGGLVFGWGENGYGQLGLGSPGEQESSTAFVPKPRQAKALSTQHVIQLAVGNHHSLALTQGGAVYSWGRNHLRQLGLSSSYPASVSVPTYTESLRGFPVKQISAGGDHNFVVSTSSSLYAWGSNGAGQLGLGKVMECCATPTLVDVLRNLHPCYVSCGGMHTAFLMEDGGVFTCGRGREGQLGHGSWNDISSPRKILELMGTTVCQVACGRNHTIVLEKNKGQVYCFGSNSHGQLGNRDPDKLATPAVVKCAFDSTGTGTHGCKNNSAVRKLIASGNQTYALLTNQSQASDGVLDFRMETHLNTPLRIPGRPNSSEFVPLEEIAKLIPSVFNSTGCVNSSFLLSSHRHGSRADSGVDVEAARTAFDGLLQTWGTEAVLLKCKQWVPQLLRDAPRTVLDDECLRFCLILTTTPIFHSKLVDSNFDLIIEPFLQFCEHLHAHGDRVTQVLGRWLVAESSHFEQVVDMVTAILNQAVKSSVQHIAVNQFMAQGWKEKPYLLLQNGLPFLGLLHMWNKTMNQEGIPHTRFHLKAVTENIDITLDYKYWTSRGMVGSQPLTRDTVTFCQFPFTLDAGCKGKLLDLESRINQSLVAQQSQYENLLQGYVGRPYLELVVTRENILRNAANQLGQIPPSDLKKTLKVTFKGEEGDDEGGVRKEFFMLVLRELLRREYGLFREDEESHLVWFNESLEQLQSEDDCRSYQLAGILCGLAIYNSALIDMPFPSAIYKMILGSPPNLKDLQELKPSVGRSLQEVLTYPGDRLEEDLALTFDAPCRSFGEVIRVPLVEGGGEIPVTSKNRHEYVDAYVHHVMFKSVETIYNEFKRGFLKLFDSKVLQLFHYQELADLVRGQKVIDFNEFEKVVIYRHSYSPEHPVIQNFWSVFHQLSVESKMKFLAFLTGSDRVPVSGFKGMNVIIQPCDCGPLGNRLPVAHTCFNLLDLPPYRSKEIMREKLLQAINFTEGFGLV